MKGCPNKNSKEFKELSRILGDNYTFYVLEKNNSNYIDRTPTGKESKLFKDLQDKHGRINAIAYKSAIYTDAFINFYGDWINDEEILTDNEEPYLADVEYFVNIYMQNIDVFTEAKKLIASKDKLPISVVSNGVYKKGNKFYYNLSDGQKAAIKKYLEISKQDKVGTTKKGFYLQGGEYMLGNYEKGDIILKVERGREYLYIESKEKVFIEDDGILSPKYITTGIYKLPIHFERNSISEEYKKFINSKYKKYMILEKGRTPKKIAFTIKNILHNVIGDIPNKIAGPETILDKIEDKLNQKSKQELIDNILGIYKELLWDKHYDEIEKVLNIMPKSYINKLNLRVLSYDVGNINFFRKPNYKITNILKGYESLVMRYALTNAFKEGKITEEQRQDFNNRITKFINRNIKNKMYPGDGITSLYKELSSDIINDVDIIKAKSKVLKEIEEYGYFTLFRIIRDLSDHKYSIPNINIAGSGRYRIPDSPSQVFIHELGHSLDYYLQYNNPSLSDSIEDFYQELLKTKEFRKYLLGNMYKRGYINVPGSEFKADFFGYLFAKSAGVPLEGTLKVLDEYIEENKEKVENILSKSFKSDILLEEQYNYKELSSFDKLIMSIRKVLNKLIEKVNTLVGKEVFKPLKGKFHNIKTNTMEYNAFTSLYHFLGDANNFRYANLPLKMNILKYNNNTGTILPIPNNATEYIIDSIVGDLVRILGTTGDDFMIEGSKISFYTFSTEDNDISIEEVIGNNNIKIDVGEHKTKITIDLKDFQDKKYYPNGYALKYVKSNGDVIFISNVNMNGNIIEPAYDGKYFIAGTFKNIDSESFNRLRWENKLNSGKGMGYRVFTNNGEYLYLKDKYLQKEKKIDLC